MAKFKSATGLAWLLTCLVGAVLASSRLVCASFSACRYEPHITLDALTVVGLIWAAYFTWEGVQQQRRHHSDALSRRRRALAQVVLVEIARLQNALYLFLNGPGSRKSETEIARPVLTHAIANADAFDRLITVFRLAASIYDLGAFDVAVHEWDKWEDVRLTRPSDRDIGVILEPAIDAARARADAALESLDRLRAECANELLAVPDERPDPIYADANVVLQAITAFGTATAESQRTGN